MQSVNNSSVRNVSEGSARAPSLDDLFRRSVARRPDAEALIDPQDKLRVTGSEPLRLTYAQASCAIANLAAHFAAVPLPAGSTVAIQLPNTAEMFLAVLAAMRAGLNVALIPLLWRKADLTDALNRIGARAIVTMSRIDGVDYTAHAMQAAVDAFSVRHIGAFGADVPDGLVALDEIMFGGDADTRLSSRDTQRASFITFDMTARGLLVVPRTQVQLIANGLGLTMGLDLPAGPRIMSAIMPSSAAGFCLSGVAWLISGGTLLLHHPFDEGVLLRALADEACTDFIAPAALALRLGDNPEFSAASELGHVVGLWRNPDQALGSSVWTGRQGFHDVMAFGEAGFVPTLRDETGAATPITMTAGSASASVGEIIMTPAGTLGLRGPAVPSLAYADGGDGGRAASAPNSQDHIDTGFAARHDPATGTVYLTAPPAGLIGVGGYRFRSEELEDWSHRLPQGGLLTALPDRMTGHRLAGRTVNAAAARGLLSELGLNPLVGDAFRDRS